VSEPEGAAWLELTIEHRSADGRLDGVLARRLRSEPLEASFDYEDDTPRYAALARAPSPYGPRLTRFTVREHGDLVYVFALASRAETDRMRFEPALEAMAGSLASLGPGDAERARPWRLALVRAQSATDIGTLALANGVPEQRLAEVRALNRAAGAQLAPGTLIKVPR
jgi:predicted Zn-dependent protease